jgi:hypothetical protein
MKEKFFLILASLVFLAVFGFLIYKTGQSGSVLGGVVSYQPTDTERPRLKLLGENLADLGTLKVSEERQATFKIKNEGEKTLQIFGGATNCGCTFGRVKTSSGESPFFGMHSNQSFLVEIAPQEEAQVEVVYRPYLMPVYGKVQRAVQLKTNDPEKPEVEFVVEASVE